jgi:acyl carrier protein
MSIADRVIAVCEQQSGKEAHRDSSLVEDLDLDSLDRIELAMVLEDTFLIEITDAEVDNPMLDSVGALIDLVEQKLAA